MRKKQFTEKARFLALRKETLRRLGTSDLQEVAGGASRIRIPIGYGDDTTPIYADVDDTNP